MGGQPFPRRSRRRLPLSLAAALVAAAKPADARLAAWRAGARARAGVGNATATASLGLDGVASNANASAPFTARADPAVGKVWALYYSDAGGGHKATAVEAPDHFPYRRGTSAGDVWHGNSLLPSPSCQLRLVSQTRYPTANRKANLRLAEIAVCDYMGSVPSCGGSGSDPCELKIKAPLPASDDLQEPHIGAAIALAAYSRLCALGRSEYEQEGCRVHLGEVGVSGGLELAGDSVRIAKLPSSGFIDLKMDAAYELGFAKVLLPAASEDDFSETQFSANSTDVLKWSRTPPEVDFCGDLGCLVSKLIG